MTEYLGEILNQNDGRVVIAQNHNSTNSNITSEKIDQARKDFIDDPKLRHRLLILPERENYGHTLLDIQETLRPGDILVAAGGDGTANSAALSIMGHTDKEIRKTPLLILPGGNANLGSNDLLSKQGRNVPLIQLLGGGKIIDFRPMSLTIYNPLLDGPRLDLAFFISGLGAPARAEYELERRRNKLMRKNPVTRMAVDSISIISGAIKQNRDPINFSVNGVEYEGAGLLSSNVNRYAKVLPTPTSTKEEGFDSLIFPDAKLSSQLSIATKAMLGRIAWQRTEADQILEIGIISEAGQIVDYETDAEPRSLPFDESEEVRTRIIQRVHDESIKMITF
jgi:diacylglycerol kinase family enzyme